MKDHDKKSGERDAPDAEGGEKPREVGDRPNVGTVTPDDYPDTRKGS